MSQQACALSWHDRAMTCHESVMTCHESSLTWAEVSATYRHLPPPTDDVRGVWHDFRGSPTELETVSKWVEAKSTG